MNLPVQGVSFDLWGTLIKSHPDYKTARAFCIRDFVRKKMHVDINTPEFVFDTIRGYEKHLDCYSEATGKQMHVNEAYQTLLYLLGYRADIEDIIQLRRELYELLLKYPPQPIEGAIDLLNELWLDKVKMVICSNTNLITGSALVRAFKELDNKMFDYFNGKLVFSDRVGCSKPSTVIFMEAFAMLRSKTTEGIYHIGDNPVTDGACEKWTKAKFILVNHKDTDLKIGDVYEYFKKEGLCKEQLPSI